ncbi:uncharacterized protein LOC126897273 [Daktulosphaira vitifoliae]|uniref:uncharacterized protein LOC126897273 n=1 Tax=Daktulosphaira vitifoliae TaxID=58002 RepID=UPI0021AAD784|nr:uncharacterized protein LOC126897273 [Daktulosphaira vitifoliae]
MLFRLFIFNFYSFWILNQSSMVSCTFNLQEYFIYVIKVFNHIRRQDGWDLESSYFFRTGENSYKMFYLKEILTEAVDENNFVNKIPMINILINLRYTETVKVFKHLLCRFVQKCDGLHNKMEFINCSKELRKTVNKSSDMFRKLLHAAVFLSNIIDELNKNYKLNLISINNQMALMYGLTKKNASEYNRIHIAKKVVANIRNLIYKSIDKKTIIELDKINIKSIYFTENSVQATLLTLYGITIMPDTQQVTDTIEDLSSTLNLFYLTTIQNEFQGLGFEKLIDPNIIKNIERPNKENVKGLYNYQLSFEYDMKE